MPHTIINCAVRGAMKPMPNRNGITANSLRIASVMGVNLA